LEAEPHGDLAEQADLLLRRVADRRARQNLGGRGISHQLASRNNDCAGADCLDFLEDVG
jgi:hypothetical protein